jgi:hypothetical protein
MTDQYEKARKLEAALRRDIAAYGLSKTVEVRQVVMNVVNVAAPYGYAVQVADARTGGLMHYVRSWEQWRDEIKPDLLDWLASRVS